MYSKNIPKNTKKYNTNAVNDRVKKDAAGIWTLSLLYSNWFLTHWATFQTYNIIIWFIDSKWIFFHLLAKIDNFCLFLTNFNRFFWKNRDLTIKLSNLYIDFDYGSMDGELTSLEKSQVRILIAFIIIVFLPFNFFNKL